MGKPENLSGTRTQGPIHTAVDYFGIFRSPCTEVIVRDRTQFFLLFNIDKTEILVNKFPPKIFTAKMIWRYY